MWKHSPCTISKWKTCQTVHHYASAVRGSKVCEVLFYGVTGHKGAQYWLSAASLENYWPFFSLFFLPLEDGTINLKDLTSGVYRHSCYKTSSICFTDDSKWRLQIAFSHILKQKQIKTCEFCCVILLETQGAHGPAFPKQSSIFCISPWLTHRPAGLAVCYFDKAEVQNRSGHGNWRHPMRE